MCMYIHVRTFVGSLNRTECGLVLPSLGYISHTWVQHSAMTTKLLRTHYRSLTDFVHTYTCTYIKYTYIHSSIHTNLHTYKYISIHTCTYIHTHIHTYTHMYLRTCMHTYTCTWFQTALGWNVGGRACHPCQLDDVYTCTCTVHVPCTVWFHVCYTYTCTYIYTAAIALVLLQCTDLFPWLSKLVCMHLINSPGHITHHTGETIKPIVTHTWSHLRQRKWVIPPIHIIISIYQLFYARYQIPFSSVMYVCTVCMYIHVYTCMYEYYILHWIMQFIIASCSFLSETNLTTKMHG